MKKLLSNLFSLFFVIIITPFALAFGFVFVTFRIIEILLETIAEIVTS